VTEEVLEVAVDADAAMAEALRSEERERKTTFIGRFEAGMRAHPGDPVELGFRTEKAHFFDLDTGAAIPT
jgi:multiple sugar transport system ATP-binding protein